MTIDSSPGFIPGRVAVLGIGLLGGSVGLSLRRHGINVVGFSRRESSRQNAVQCGAVTEAFDSIQQACEGADVVVIASPVDHIAALAMEAAKSLADDSLITDVGSTKAELIEEIASDPRAASMLVAAHPIAGSELTGVENSSADLFDQKMIVITPTEDNPPELVDRAIDFWRLTGGNIVTMQPDHHDQQLAAISHVPHLMASLIAGLPAEASLQLVGSGWIDLTRVASGDPDMWTAICQHNAAAISDQLAVVIERVTELRRRVDQRNADGLHAWLEAAKQRRDGVVESSPE